MAKQLSWRATILGDNGMVQMDAEGNNYAKAATLSLPSVGTTYGLTTNLGGGDNITVMNVTLVNPYRGVRIGPRRGRP